ncbi:hypothetical protein GCM10020001_091310 [Nonomuraea salmonea]
MTLMCAAPGYSPGAAYVTGWYMRRVRIRRDLPVPMPDGVTLLADHYAPPHGGPAPVVLMRSPYGRRGMLGWYYGRGFARQGLHVVIQSCRGGFGSGGLLDPLGDEHDDGLATIALAARATLVRRLVRHVRPLLSRLHAVGRRALRRTRAEGDGHPDHRLPVQGRRVRGRRVRAGVDAELDHAHRRHVAQVRRRLGADGALA